MMSGIRISDDGATVVFMRGDGAEPRRLGRPIRRPIRTARARRLGRAHRGGAAWRVVDDAPTRSSRRMAARCCSCRDGQIYRAKVTPVKPGDRGGSRREAVHHASGACRASPKWSPDGRKIAFVSTRTDHSFIVVYDVATRTVKYMSPSVDFDTSPMWTADSKQLMFVRRPGLPFGQQAQQGAGGIGNAEWTGVSAARGTRPGARARRRCRGARRNRGRGGDSGDRAGRLRRPRARVNTARPDARDVQGRLHAGVLQSGRRRPARRRRPGTTSPTTRMVTNLDQRAAGGRLASSSR